jgi:hypothetical protein
LIIFTKYFCKLDDFSTQGENSVQIWTGKSESRITSRIEVSDSDKHSSLLHKVVNQSCALYYKPITIVNDDSRVINKFEASFTDDARVTNYNRHMFIVHVTDMLTDVKKDFFLTHRVIENKFIVLLNT